MVSLLPLQRKTHWNYKPLLCPWSNPWKPGELLTLGPALSECSQLPAVYCLTMQSKDNASGMLLIQKYMLVSSKDMTARCCIHVSALQHVSITACLHTPVSFWRITRCSCASMHVCVCGLCVCVCVDSWVLLTLSQLLSLSHSGHLGNKANFIRTLQSCIPQILSTWQPANTQSEEGERERETEREREWGGWQEKDRRKKRKAGEIKAGLHSPYSVCYRFEYNLRYCVTHWWWVWKTERKFCVSAVQKRETQKSCCVFTNGFARI